MDIQNLESAFDAADPRKIVRDFLQGLRGEETPSSGSGGGVPQALMAEATPEMHSEKARVAVRMDVDQSLALLLMLVGGLALYRRITGAPEVGIGQWNMDAVLRDQLYAFWNMSGASAPIRGRAHLLQARKAIQRSIPLPREADAQIFLLPGLVGLACLGTPGYGGSLSHAASLARTRFDAA